MTTHLDEDGSVRQDYYGAARQPWDDIVAIGWGPAFAAGNVLKYLRRTKDPEHSLESARWYWRQIEERTRDESTVLEPWLNARVWLGNLLTADEMRRLLP